jgi:uncharacterized protein (DUF1499 family)
MGTPQLRSSDGSLAPCDSAPHCVSSMGADRDHAVEPIRYDLTRAAAQQAMTKIVSGMEGAQIVTNQPGYIHATYASSLMGFVDDLELVFPAEKIIQLRSSSRIGYYDFGVNRKRVETLRKAFSEAQP